MIQQLLSKVIEVAGPAIINGLKSAGKSIAAHFAKNWKRYAAGGAAAGGSAFAYEVGKGVGHKEGKKEGCTEQAKRDEIIIADLSSKHNADRERWASIDKEKDKVIDELLK